MNEQSWCVLQTAVFIQDRRQVHLLPAARPVGDDTRHGGGLCRSTVAHVRKGQGDAAGSAADAAASASAAEAAVEGLAADYAYYDTKADATAAVGGLPDHQLVLVAVDESRNGQRSYYRKESGSLVYKFGVPDLSNNSAALAIKSLSIVQDVNGAPVTMSNGLRSNVIKFTSAGIGAGTTYGRYGRQHCAAASRPCGSSTQR